MSVFDQVGRFLEHGSEVLGEASLLMRDSRDALAAARRTLDGLPALMVDTHGLVVEAREAVRILSPLLVDGARHTIRLLEAEASKASTKT